MPAHDRESLRSGGAFYDSHHSRRELYTTVQISAFDTPNLKAHDIVVPGMVSGQDIADRKDEWGEESALYIVLGKFPDNLDDVVVPLWAATEAGKRELEPDGPLIAACDVARHGQDKTVVMTRQGPVARIAWRVRGRDTMQIAGFFSFCREHPVETLVVDDTGWAEASSTGSKSCVQAKRRYTRSSPGKKPRTKTNSLTVSPKSGG